MNKFRPTVMRALLRRWWHCLRHVHAEITSTEGIRVLNLFSIDLHYKWIGCGCGRAFYSELTPKEERDLFARFNLKKE